MVQSCQPQWIEAAWMQSSMQMATADDTIGSVISHPSARYAIDRVPFEAPR
jgi:hypothetical protein